MSIASEWSRDRTPSAELRAAWRDLLAAAREAGYAVDELVRPPATPDQIAAAEQAIGRRLPDDLADLYLLSDGQVDWLELTTGRVGARGRGRWVGGLFGAGWSFDPLPQLVSGLPHVGGHPRGVQRRRSGHRLRRDGRGARG